MSEGGMGLSRGVPEQLARLVTRQGAASSAPTGDGGQALQAVVRG